MRVTGSLRLEDADGSVWEVEIHGFDVDPADPRNVVGVTSDYHSVPGSVKVWAGPDRLVVHMEGCSVDGLAPVYTARLVEPAGGA